MHKFNELEIDFIKEIFNVGLGAAGAELSELIEDEVILSVPSFELIKVNAVPNRIGIEPEHVVTCVSMALGDALEGQGKLIFPATNSLELVNALANEMDQSRSMTDLEKEALTEVSGIILNNIIDTLCDFLDVTISTGLPQSSKAQLNKALGEEEDVTQEVMFVGMNFQVKKLSLTGEIIFIQNVESTKAFGRYVGAALKAQGF